MSTFIKAKKEKISQNLPNERSSNFGVKPWIHSNSGIVSSGNRELDRILGGGHVIGTSLLIHGDGYSLYSDTLLQYELAEAICMQHHVILISDNDNILNSLPFNCNFGISNDADVVDVSEKNIKSNDLNIAWQYGKYLNKDAIDDNLSSKKSDDLKGIFCCSYDLSRRLQEVLISRKQFTFINYKSNNSLSAENSFNKMASHIMNSLECCTTNNSIIYRIFIPNLQNLIELNDFSDKSNDRNVLQFLLSLQHYMNKYNRMTLTVSLIDNMISSKTINILNNIFDTSITLESFIGRNNNIPYEFNEYNGFLVIDKLQQFGIVAPYRPPYSRYGLKRNHKKLSIEPLHLPPEDSRAFGSSGTDEQLVAKSNVTKQSSSTEKNLISTKDNSKIQISFEEVPATEAKPDKKKSLSDALANARAFRESRKINTETTVMQPGTFCQNEIRGNKSLDF